MLRQSSPSRKQARRCCEYVTVIVCVTVQASPQIPLLGTRGEIQKRVRFFLNGGRSEGSGQSTGTGGGTKEQGGNKWEPKKEKKEMKCAKAKKEAPATIKTRKND
eukprot:RCo055671